MFRKVLVAIDASECSRLVVPAAVEIARKFQSEVFVLHVSDRTESPAAATSLVGTAIKQFRDAGIEAEGQVRHAAAGHVAKNIADTARELESDLIVMGSRGLSDVQGVLLRSVTHKVMQLTHTAVLVTRGPIPVKEPATTPAINAALPAFGI